MDGAGAENASITYRERSGVRYAGSSIHSDGWRGYTGLVDMGKSISGCIMVVQNSMVFPDERSFYTARNVNSNFITDEGGRSL